MNRRTFLKEVGMAGAAIAISPLISKPLLASIQKRTARVAFVKTNDRAAGVRHAIDLLGLNSFSGKDVFLKPNFNSADTPPGSTHIDTLNALLLKLRKMGADRITIGDRSGMGNTREVMEQKGVFTLAKEQNVRMMVFDELRDEDWELVRQNADHWGRGFAFPRPVKNSNAIVQTCCLKTHRYGGHFTLSLKNSVGLAAKFVPGNPYNFMAELHSSPNQRRMIAEINAAYQPDLVVLDGVEAFVNGGPESGKKVNSEVILAGTDRVAVDAVGVALLRHFGTTEEVSRGPIFQQEQIARAVELNLGVDSPDHIELITDDPASSEYAKQIRETLSA